VTLGLLLVTETFWVAATVLLGPKLKLKEFGFATSGLVPVEPAFNVTGMLSEPAEDVTLINAVLVPEVGALAPTETVIESGVVPLVGLTVSQLFADDGVTVTLTGALDVSRIVCDGVVTPDCVLNVSCGGFAANVL